MEIKNKLNIITNISIVITMVFIIILLIDELYNIGLFSFKYTYNYNYGTFNSKFNNIQTIECETNRFKVYNNNNYLFKDIFNKSYFNYLLKIAMTFITIMFIIAYGIYFYDNFIDRLPELCSFSEAISLPKQILECLCKDCHKILPNCTNNYLIVFIIIILIPIAYLCKSFLWFDFTPNSNSTLLTLVYVLIFIMLIFKYPFDLLIAANPDTKYKELITYFIVTFVFIVSGYLYKYIDKKYINNIKLNSVNNINVFNDIYKQAPPIKPLPVTKPDIIDTFKYNVKNTDPAYKIQKEIADRYYRDIKNYETELNYYTERYNNYTNSINTSLKDKITVIDVFFNISGLNNYLHIFIIALIIIIALVYYNYSDKNQMLFVCMIYLISLITILTIFNAIQYYNTYINKYIIYEPSANYKSDVTVVNTKLNLILDTSNGQNFYNILTNSHKTYNKIENDIIITRPTINSQIRNLSSDNIIEKLAEIDTNIRNLPEINVNDKNKIKSDYTVYFNGNNAPTQTNIEIFKFFYKNIDKFTSTSINKFPVDNLYFTYKNNLKITVRSDYHRYSNLYIYYKSYQYYKFIDRLEVLNFRDVKKLKLKYYNLLREIYNNYSNIQKLNFRNNAQIVSDIDTDIKSINSDTIVNMNIDTNFNNFIKNELNTINIAELYRLPKLSGSDYIEFMISPATPKTIYISPNPPNVDIVDNYIEMPTTITDDSNNEYSFITNDGVTYSNIRIKFAENISSEIKVTPAITFTKSNENDYYISTDNSIITFPFKVMSGISDNNNVIFINMIMIILLNTLTSMSNNFDNQDLCKAIYKGGDEICVVNPNTNKFISYASTVFNTFNLGTDITTYIGDTKFINNLDTTDNYYGYLILLYNIYNYDEERLIDIIEYVVYSNVSKSSLGDISSDDNLNIKLNKIKTQINRTNTTRLSNIYKNNINIVKFIVKLYTLFINKIKYTIETKIDKSLCMPTTLNKNSKEQFILDYITKNFTVNITTNSATVRNTINKTEIIKISNYCKYFFNICLYLLKNNVNSEMDLSMQAVTNSIISNYKFYNTEDIDEIDLNELRQLLSINCNYSNKYNNMNTKQLLTMQSNTDAVTYNFPVLVVILFVFLGETLFIKS